MIADNEYLTNHPSCIENLAKRKFGATEDFQLAGYILWDGTMLNFSYDGIRRSEDHRIISQFLKGEAQGTDAVIAFMCRGNTRVSCSKTSYNFEFIRKPSREQNRLICNGLSEAHWLGISGFVDIDDRFGRTIHSFSDKEVIIDNEFLRRVYSGLPHPTLE